MGYEVNSEANVRLILARDSGREFFVENMQPGDQAANEDMTAIVQLRPNSLDSEVAIYGRLLDPAISRITITWPTGYQTDAAISEDSYLHFQSWSPVDESPEPATVTAYDAAGSVVSQLSFLHSVYDRTHYGDKTYRFLYPLSIPKPHAFLTGCAYSVSMGKDIVTLIKTARSDEEREWFLLKMILDTLEPALYTAVCTVAIPHWFDDNFLTVLLDEAERQQLEELGGFGRLANLELVEPSDWLVPGQAYSLDENSRALLLNRMWQEEPGRFQALSQRAAAYCAQQDQSQTPWRLETIYHLLVADPDEGATQFQFAARAWQNPPHFAYDKVETLTRFAGEHGTAGRLAERGLGWFRYWDAYLDRLHACYPVAKDKLLQIDVSPDIDGCLAADVALTLGDVERVMDQYDSARESYQVAYTLYRELGDSLGEAKAIKSLGDVHFSLDEYGSAYQDYEEACRLYREAGDRLGEANCVKAAGDVHRLLSEYSLAWQAYGEARFLYRQVGDSLGEANCIKALGDIHLDLSEHQLARQSYEIACLLYCQIGERLGEANCRRGLGNIHRLLGEYEPAGCLYEEALATYRAIGDQMGEANCLKSLGDVHRALEDCDYIWPWYEAARYLHLEIGNYLDATNCLFGLADLDLQQGNWREAAGGYREALAYYEEVGMSQNVALAHWRLGLAVENMGDLREAEHHYQTSYNLFNQIGSSLAENLAEHLAALQVTIAAQQATVLARRQRAATYNQLSSRLRRVVHHNRRAAP